MTGPLLVATSLLLGTCAIWTGVYWGRQRIAAWIVLEPRRIFSADLVDVIATFAILFIGSSLAIFRVAPEAAGDLLKMTPAERVASIHWQAGISLGTILLSTCLILGRHGLKLSEVGWSLRAVGRDLALGVLGFLVLVPPVYALQSVLVIWFESHHPLMELLKDNPPQALVMACALSAVVAAPIAEEFLFRGMLLSWLEWLAAWHEDWGGERPTSGMTKSEVLRHAQQPVEGRPGLLPPNPFFYGRVPESTGARADQADDADVAAAAWWPVVASAILFALLHASHGPDWIPLFFLALGLGLLYRLTRRLLPCIVVHFLLNACSLVMFLWENQTV